MILSVVILSYNRPFQLQRILDNLIELRSSDLEVVIKDDRSPRSEEILSIFEKYEKLMGFRLRLHFNEKNLGYDSNLLDGFNIVDSDYIFLLSDDDYLDGSRVEGLISMVAQKKYKVYFTPYCVDGVWRRSEDYPVRSDIFSRVIYDSILFSGLVFNVDSVRKLDKDIEFLKDCIYSQVYLAGMLAFSDRCVGRCPEGILYLGGDGENFFGKNESAKNSSVLEDRSSITANLDYQNFLIKVVQLISKKTNPIILRSFYYEYKKRLIGYAFSARGLGLSSYKVFLRHFTNNGIDTGTLNKVLLYLIVLVPSPIASRINRLGVKYLRKSG